MSEEKQLYSNEVLNKFRQWHFWWLVVFSGFLIVTFVYYLPTMFLNKSMGTHGDTMGMPIDESQPHGHDGDEHMTDEHMQEHMEGGMTAEEMDEHMMQEEHTEDGEHMMSDGEVMTDTSVGVLFKEEGDIKDGIAVNLNISPVPYNINVPLSINFFVNQKPRNLPVLASQLELEHTKLMHVIGLRSDMNEFFHVHPDFLVNDQSVFSVEHTFQKPGLYKIWSSIKKDGVDYVFGHPEVNINGSGPREEKKISFTRNVIAGDYQVSLVMDDTPVINKEIGLSFDIHSLNGQEVTVEDYLGAQMHLVLIKDDWKQFIHTHPGGSGHEHSSNTFINIAHAQGDGHTDHDHGTPTGGTSGGDEVITFNAIFPEAGLYKSFAQFRPQGIDLPLDEAITAEFWIQVEEKSPFPVSQWWGLLIVSAILMAGLSWVVNNYLKVKAEDITVKK